MELRKRIRLAVSLFVSVIICGALGYMILEGWSLLDSFYMTVITIATVGFGEIRPLSAGGRVFTIFLIIGGLGVAMYTFSLITQSFVEGEIKLILGRRKLEKKIGYLRDHYIICGFGRIGHIIADELERKGYNFVIIESDPERLDFVDQHGFLGVSGDATLDENLIKAGVERANCLIATTTSDATNLFITVAARQLNPNIYIIVRADEEHAEAKFLRAGANKVVCPYRIGAMQLAHAAIRPNVIDFLEIAVRTEKSLEYAIEEVRVPASSQLVSKSLKELALSRSVGIIVIGIKRGEKMMFNPSAESVVEANDILIVLGNAERLKNLEALVLSPAKA